MVYVGSELIHKTNSLYTSHCQAWAGVWQRGRIDIVDNVKIARAVYSSFFYIISSLPLQHDPASPFYGLSPSGLAFGYDTVCLILDLLLCGQVAISNQRAVNND